MTKTAQARLLDNLLKTRYPLTYYLIRQQEFVKVFSTTETNVLPITFESEMKTIVKQKASLSYHLSDTKVPQVSKFNKIQNEFNSDPDYYTTYEQSSDTDDNDDTKEYDARPLLKNDKEKHKVKK
ncbi:unnamed protein product [Adineta steineri]|uniref:Uncharacterized protein n=1 Tax=Adineta steineri TaxID=433720 RepID=A0A819EFC4_9BILA|nr:unnamed protein product [Adineta steineri]